MLIRERKGTEINFVLCVKISQIIGDFISTLSRSMQHGNEQQERQLTLAQVEASHAFDYEQELSSVQSSIDTYNMKFDMIKRLTNSESLDDVVRTIFQFFFELLLLILI